MKLCIESKSKYSVFVELNTTNLGHLNFVTRSREMSRMVENLILSYRLKKVKLTCGLGQTIAF